MTQPNHPTPASGSRGDWGESRLDHVDVDRARADFEEVVRSVSRTSQQQQQESTATVASTAAAGTSPNRTRTAGLSKILSRGPNPSAVEEETNEKHGNNQQRDLAAAGSVLESQAVDEDEQEEDQRELFDLREFIMNRQAQAESEGKITHHKPVGVAWRNLSVYAPPGSGGGVFVKTLPQAILNTATRDPWAIATFLCPPLKKITLFGGKGNDTKQPMTLLHEHLGVLRPSEMLLVLGRPGSGCTTTLRALTGNLASNLTRSGDLTYGGFGLEEVARKLRGEVIFVDEDDLHFPTLTVAQTLRFALRTKVPHRKTRVAGEKRGEFIETLIDVLLKMVSNWQALSPQNVVVTIQADPYFLFSSPCRTYAIRL